MKRNASGKRRITTRSASPRRQRRRNPESEAIERFEDFHGPDSASEVIEVDTVVKDHGYVAAIGELIQLEIETPDGDVVELSKFDGAMLTMNETGTQIFIDGGDTSVNLDAFGIDEEAAHEKEVLGVVLAVTYFTDKNHLGDEGGEAEYTHEFGEEGGDPPTVIYDVRNGLLSFAGGDYTLPSEGIRN